MRRLRTCKQRVLVLFSLARVLVLLHGLPEFAMQQVGPQKRKRSHTDRRRVHAFGNNNRNLPFGCCITLLLIWCDKYNQNIDGTIPYYFGSYKYSSPKFLPTRIRHPLINLFGQPFQCLLGSFHTAFDDTMALTKVLGCPPTKLYYIVCRF